MTWRPAPLKRWLLQNDSGVWGEDPDPTEVGTPVVRSTDIRLDGSWDLEGVARRKLSPDEQAKAILHLDDLVVVTASGSEIHLGKTAIVDESVCAMGAAFSNFVQRLRPSADADARYIRYLLASSNGRADMVRLGTTTTGLRNLSGSLLGSLTSPGPPLDEQRRIADFLDAETSRIDALITAKRQMIRIVEDRSTSVLDATLHTRDWRVRSDGVPIGIGYGPSARLGVVAQIQSGLTLDAGRVFDHLTSLVPYMRVANVQDGHIETDDIKTVEVDENLASRHLLQRGDVLMTEGGDPDKLGRGAVWRGQVDPCLHQNHVFAVRPVPGVLDPDFLALLTRTTYARAYFEMTATKTTGIASTSASKIAGFGVPMPSLEHQQRIVSELRTSIAKHQNLKSTLTRQIELLRERRQALITAAVTGELAV